MESSRDCKFTFAFPSLTPPPFTYLTDPRTSSTTIMTLTVKLALSTLVCESSILLTRSLLIFSHNKTPPFSRWTTLLFHLSPASLSTSLLKSLRTPATENPWTSGWQVWSLPHAYTNERQAHCFLSLYSHYHVRSPLRLLPFLYRQHQGPCPAKCWFRNWISESVPESDFWWSQVLYLTSRRPRSTPLSYPEVLCDLGLPPPPP